MKQLRQLLKSLNDDDWKYPPIDKMIGLQWWMVHAIRQSVHVESPDILQWHLLQFQRVQVWSLWWSLITCKHVRCHDIVKRTLPSSHTGHTEMSDVTVLCGQNLDEVLLRVHTDLLRCKLNTVISIQRICEFVYIQCSFLLWKVSIYISEWNIMDDIS